VIVLTGTFQVLIEAFGVGIGPYGFEDVSKGEKREELRILLAFPVLKHQPAIQFAVIQLLDNS
jgi:hypothetical protein